MIPERNPRSTVWSVTDSLDHGRPAIYRYRHFPRTYARDRLPHQLDIIWEMSYFTSLGLPEPLESDRMSSFEDRLVKEVEADDFAVLSLVITTNAHREYVFHASNAVAFLARLKSLPREDSYPIKVTISEDPDWELDQKILDSILN